MKAKPEFLTASYLVQQEVNRRKRYAAQAREEIQEMRDAKAHLMPVLKTITGSLKELKITWNEVSVYVSPDSVEVVFYDLRSYKDARFAEILFAVLEHCDLEHVPNVVNHEYSPARTYECRTATGVKVNVKGYLDSKNATCKIEEVTEPSQLTKYKVTCD